MHFSQDVRAYAVKAHSDTNHLYDGYLPYEFHLRMVVSNAMRFMPLIIKEDLFMNGKLVHWDFDAHKLYHVILSACWCHDLIEDARKNYSDIQTKIFALIAYGNNSGVPYKYQEGIAKEVADLVYAVSNEKGKSRKERECNRYFKGIRDIPYAIFVKLCDRLANIEYSKLTKQFDSGKLEMYYKEHEHFKKELYQEQYKEMFERMEELLFNKKPEISLVTISTPIPEPMVFTSDVHCSECKYIGQPVKKDIFFTTGKGIRVHRQIDYCFDCEHELRYCERFLSGEDDEKDTKEKLTKAKQEWKDVDNPDTTAPEK